MYTKPILSTRRVLETVVVSALILLTSPLAQAYEPAGTPDDWPPPIKEMNYGMLRADRLEVQRTDGRQNYLWDIQGWYGGDFNRITVKSEGVGREGQSPEDAEVQLLYSRLVAPFWEFQAGIRYDIRPRPQTTHAVIGFQGIVPYQFEADMSLFLSENGRLSFSGEFEYDLLLTQKLILQPRFAVAGAVNKDTDSGLQRGLTSTELDLRLRYEFVRQFGPYIGMSWTQLYGATAGDAERDGGKPSNVAVVAGLRLWF